MPGSEDSSTFYELATDPTLEDTMAPEVDVERLLFRRQYVLGPRPYERFAFWKRVAIRRDLFLTAHPDLHIEQVIAGGKSLTLLGFILDSRNPKSEDATVLEAIFPELCSGSDPRLSLQCTNPLGGRWILIVDDGVRITLAGDALGQRPIYYNCQPVHGETWCGSQPGVIAEILQLAPSQQAKDFREAQIAAGQIEWWYPNDLSAYDEIKLVLPNHYLNLHSARTQRFWPRQRLTRIGVRRAAKEGARIIKALLAGAAKRFPLGALITAGWDSRVVFAATKDLESEVNYVTFVTQASQSGNPDIDVPARLLPKFGKAHHLLRIPEAMHPAFAELFRQNVTPAHESYGALTQALYEDGQTFGVRVSGGGSETVRQQLRPAGYEYERVTPDTLSRFAKARNEFAIAAFSQWLSGIPANLDYDLLDLFYWEQKCGQWLAVGQVELDLGPESFTPYSCRTLLETLLATHRDYRLGPDYELYRVMLTELSAAVLIEPINPHKGAWKPARKRRIRRALVRLHVREYIPDLLLDIAR
jgi:hypothetical protein